MVSGVVGAAPRLGAGPGPMKAPRRAPASSSAVWTRRAATPIPSASLTKPGVGPHQGDRAPWGPGRTQPRPVAARCAPCRRHRRCDTAVTSRVSRAGIHNPTSCPLAGGRGDRGVGGRDGVADCAAGRCQPVGGRGRGRCPILAWPDVFMEWHMRIKMHVHVAG